jgi:glycosyltransferase involved in cell wall biosynthesis
VTPQVSVIVPVYNGLPSLVAQAESLLAQDFPPPWEILYVDNGSSDGSPGFIRTLKAREGVDVRVIDATSRQGQVFARNVGAAAARSDVLVFHDQDDLADPSWLSELMEVLRTSDAVGGFVHVTSPGLEPDISPQTPAEDLHVLVSRFRTALGTNFAIRRTVLQAVGGWRDIGVFAGEDVDICARLEAHGFTLRYAPRARVTWRARQHWVGIFKQAMTYGRADVRLFLIWSHMGARLPGALAVLKQWKASGIGILRNPFSRPNVLKQIQRFAWYWGQVRERWKFGVWGPGVPDRPAVKALLRSLETTEGGSLPQAETDQRLRR